MKLAMANTLAYFVAVNDRVNKFYDIDTGNLYYKTFYGDHKGGAYPS